MPRLIDADALMRIYQEVLCPHVSCVDCSLLTNDGNCRFETMISEALTIDAVPIVRCRDCRYCDPSNGIFWCDRFDSAVQIDGMAYCSYGKQKLKEDCYNFHYY